MSLSERMRVITSVGPPAAGYAFTRTAPVPPFDADVTIVACDAADRAALADVLAAIPRDKKATDGTVGWVLPRELGRAEVGRRVPAEVVEAAVREVLGE